MSQRVACLIVLAVVACTASATVPGACVVEVTEFTLGGQFQLGCTAPEEAGTIKEVPNSFPTSFAWSTTLGAQSDHGQLLYVGLLGQGPSLSVNGTDSLERLLRAVQANPDGGVLADTNSASVGDRFRAFPLSRFSKIAYHELRLSSSTTQPSVRVSLNLVVDWAGNGSSWTTLVFEPLYQAGYQPGPDNSFERIDALLNGSAVYWSTFPIPGQQTRDIRLPFSSILDNIPNAQVLAIGFNAGSGSPGLNAMATNLTLGVGGFVPPPDARRSAARRELESLAATDRLADDEAWSQYRRVPAADDGAVDADIVAMYATVQASVDSDDEDGQERDAPTAIDQTDSGVDKDDDDDDDDLVFTFRLESAATVRDVLSNAAQVVKTLCYSKPASLGGSSSCSRKQLKEVASASSDLYQALRSSAWLPSGNGVSPKLGANVFSELVQAVQDLEDVYKLGLSAAKPIANTVTTVGRYLAEQLIQSQLQHVTTKSSLVYALRTNLDLYAGTREQCIGDWDDAIKDYYAAWKDANKIN